MCACVRTTRSTYAVRNPGCSQLSCCSSRPPLNRPASNRTRVSSISRRWRDPVTMPAAPWNPRWKRMTPFYIRTGGPASSGSVLVVQAVLRLGADLVQLRHLLGAQRGLDLVAGVVQDRVDARHHFVVDRLELQPRRVHHLLQREALCLVEIETTGETPHHELLGAIVGDAAVMQPVQAERGGRQGPAGGAEQEDPGEQEAGAGAGHGVWLHEVAASQGIDEKTGSTSTSEARSSGSL